MPPKKFSVPVDKSGRQVFLREFVRQLIINSKPKLSINQEALERIRRRVSEELPEIAVNPVSIPSLKSQSIKQPSFSAQQRPSLQRPQVNPLQRRAAIPMAQQRPFQQVPQKMNLSFKTVAPPHQAPVETSIASLGRIQPFLRDPAVMSVECPGPGKNLVINRSGIMQTSPLTLSNEDIMSILKEFSQKTKVPLIQGVFKALYSNLLITAVLSDVAGNRFIVEKHFSTPQLPEQEKK